MPQVSKLVKGGLVAGGAAGLLVFGAVELEGYIDNRHAEQCITDTFGYRGQTFAYGDLSESCQSVARLVLDESPNYLDAHYVIPAPREIRARMTAERHEDHANAFALASLFGFATVGLVTLTASGIRSEDGPMPPLWP